MEDPGYHWVLGDHGLHVGPVQSQGFAEKLHVVAAVSSIGKRDDVDSGGDAEGVEVVLHSVLLDGGKGGCRGC